MGKFLLVLQICSVIEAECLAPQQADVYNSWSDCARAGAVESLSLMNAIGDNLLNNKKILITYSCQQQNDI